MALPRETIQKTCQTGDSAIIQNNAKKYQQAKDNAIFQKCKIDMENTVKPEAVQLHKTGTPHFG